MNHHYVLNSKLGLSTTMHDQSHSDQAQEGHMDAVAFVKPKEGARMLPELPPLSQMPQDNTL